MRTLPYYSTQSKAKQLILCLVHFNYATWLQKNAHNVPLIFFVCCQTKLCFKPKRMVIDFEVAIHKAVGSIWPNVTVTGCKFHLAECCFRKM
jgi:hypothetical protein